MAQGSARRVVWPFEDRVRTVAFFGYADTRVGDATTSLEQDDRSIFVKIGYSWVL